MGSTLLAARILLAAVFATAGIAKLLDLPGTRLSLAGFGVPTRMLPVVGILLPLAELATAAALIPEGSARWGALAALALLLAFIGGILHAMSRGQAPDCHCFGQLHSAPAGPGTLARNAALAGVAILVVWKGPGPAADSWIAERSSAELVAVATAIAAGLIGALAMRLWMDKRRLHRDLAAARSELASLPPGLPVGATAPKFTLPDTRGATVALESLCERGRPVALVFVTPNCAPCAQLLPDLGRWQATLADRLTVAVISRGTPHENDPASEEHAVKDVLLQKDSEVTRRYRMGDITPSAVVVTAERRVASTPAEGLAAIEALVRLTLRRDLSTPAGAHTAAEQPAAGV